MALIVGETDGGGAEAGGGLDGLQLKRRLFPRRPRHGCRSCGEFVFIEPTVNAINDRPGEIREIRYGERRSLAGKYRILPRHPANPRSGLGRQR